MWWIVIVVVIIIGILFLGAIFELGFRNQENLDWLIYTEWCNQYFINNGFIEKGYENGTSSHPSTLFGCDDHLVRVQLNAPILIPPSFYSIDIIVDGKRMWHFPVSKNKENVYKVFDDYFKA